ncbi:MAG: efflux RND transporter periplasmic adaptor subunit [Candidatus Babeliaceae bacterium]|nr:efflux RND transporter periplasmic adaptor subunit [Candidatus Babeliaceae bacterium]
MNYRAFIFRFLFAIFIVLCGYGLYRYLFPHVEEKLYSVKKPVRRAVAHIVRATGALKPEDLLKVGSLVPGILEKMLVDENEVVKKGQLLAIVDDGKGDSEVRGYKAALEQAKAQLIYTKAFHTRQKALYEGKFISDDEFEKIDRDLTTAMQEVEIRKAKLEYAEYIFKRKKITAPENGIIIGKICSEGEAVTNFGLGTVIYTIAKDISKMEAKIEIDESNVGIIKKGMAAQLSYDAYPRKTCKCTITDISNNPIEKGGTVSYLATIPIDNSEKLLKPGMTVDAEIVIAKRENTLTVQGQQFTINPAILDKIAKLKGYAFKPLSPEKKAELLKLGDYKFIWVFRDKSFVEVPIKIGISDGAFFEVVSGINENDLIIDDTVEENAMEKLFKKFFSSGLQ